MKEWNVILSIKKIRILIQMYFAVSYERFDIIQQTGVYLNREKNNK